MAALCIQNNWLIFFLLLNSYSNESITDLHCCITRNKVFYYFFLLSVTLTLLFMWETITGIVISICWTMDPKMLHVKSECMTNKRIHGFQITRLSLGVSQLLFLLASVLHSNTESLMSAQETTSEGKSENPILVKALTRREKLKSTWRLLYQMLDSSIKQRFPVLDHSAPWSLLTSL